MEVSRMEHQYMSDLDLMTGILRMTHTQEGVRYLREMFVSNPSQVMCIRLVSDTPGAINLDTILNRCLIFDESTIDDRRSGHMVSTGGWPGTQADSIGGKKPNRILV